MDENGGIMDELKEKITMLWDKICETIRPTIKEIWKFLKKVCEIATWNFINNPEIKKCKGIYRRTKSGRIKKKQLTRIRKILRGIYERR